MKETTFIKRILDLGFKKYRNNPNGVFSYSTLYQYIPIEDVSINIQYYELNIIDFDLPNSYEIEVYYGNNKDYSIRKKYYCFQTYDYMLKVIKELMEFYNND